MELAVGAGEAEAMEAALAGPAAKWVEGKAVKKVIYVPGKILNIIVGK